MLEQQQARPGATHSTGWVGASAVSEPPGLYRPRRPQDSAFYQLLERHFDEYLYVYEERFEPSSGPLRRVVKTAVEAYLACGRPEGGFARLKCPDCKSERLLTFSCRSRNLCPSCQAKRAALFAEKLIEEVLAPVPHRHWVCTIPIALRGLFQRERALLGLLGRCAYDAVRLCLEQVFERKDVRPGCVVSLQTFGSFANFNPHAHCLISEGAFSLQGEFLSLPSLDVKAVEEVFRRLVLVRLYRAERLSEGFMQRLLGWSPSGFSVYARQLVPAHDRPRLERLARYITRPPHRVDGIDKLAHRQVRVTTPPDPTTGASVKVLDVLDWIHCVTQQVPDAWFNCVRYFGAYACRRRIAPRPTTASPQAKTTDSENADPDKTTTRASWARLMRRLFEIDPLLCTCGGSFRVISIITRPDVIDRILAHLRDRGRSADPLQHDPAARAPPTPLPGPSPDTH